jgi:hypothetical protein
MNGATRYRTAEGMAFFRWAERWQPWIEMAPEVAALLLEDWEAGVRDV